METITARLFELRQKYYEGNGDIIEWDDLVCKIAARLRHAEMKLAELGKQEPHTYVLFDGDDVEYNATDKFSSGRTGGIPLYTSPVLPAASRQQLRKLIDVVWNTVTESEEVPSTKWADELIDKVFGSSVITAVDS